MDIVDIVERIRHLDLSKNNSDQIRELLVVLLQGLPVVTTDFNYPKIIERAVCNTDEEPLFSKVSRISYKPEKFNNTYMRASTPHNTMFYGSVIPEDELSDSEISYARITGAFEIIDFLRANMDGTSLITFGKWQVKNKISVISIFDPKIEYNINYVNRIRDFYNNQDISPENKEKRDYILAFLSSEFSKRVESEQDYNYKISAIFTELAVKNGTDGVLYPSVQSGGYGLCLALHPRVMSRLLPIGVLQCELIKNGLSVKLINKKHCDIVTGSEDFILEDV